MNFPASRILQGTFPGSRKPHCKWFMDLVELLVINLDSYIILVIVPQEPCYCQLREDY